MTKIYTKTGDKGKTSLFDGTRVFKHNTRVEAYGTVDELNSFLGIAASMLTGRSAYKKELRTHILMVQNDLFEIGSLLASPQKKEDTKLLHKLADHTSLSEQLIDRLTAELPELRNFILPGGGRIGAFFQMCRTVCRRAERRMVELLQEAEVAPESIVYVNRLSDLFHTISRFVNFKEKKKEIIWKGTQA